MQLSPTQKTIIAVGVACLGLLAVYVPWIHTVHTNGISGEKPAGYHLITDPPAPEKAALYYGVKINVPQMVITMVVVLIATVAGVILTKPKPPTTQPIEKSLVPPDPPQSKVEAERPAESPRVQVEPPIGGPSENCRIPDSTKPKEWWEPGWHWLIAVPILLITKEINKRADLGMGYFGPFLIACVGIAAASYVSWLIKIPEKHREGGKGGG